MSRWLRNQMTVIMNGIVASVERSMWIRLTRRWVENVLEMVDKEERESEQMRKDLKFERERMAFGHERWPVRMDTELRWPTANGLIAYYIGETHSILKFGAIGKAEDCARKRCLGFRGNECDRRRRWFILNFYYHFLNILLALFNIPATPNLWNCRIHEFGNAFDQSAATQYGVANLE